MIAYELVATAIFFSPCKLKEYTILTVFLVPLWRWSDKTLLCAFNHVHPLRGFGVVAYLCIFTSVKFPSRTVIIICGFGVAASTSCGANYC